MAYDPADLRLPPWLLRLLDWLVRIEIPLGRRWRFGMTRPGALLAAVLLGLWLAAFYSGNNLLYLCGAVLTALTASSLWQAAAILRSVPPLAGHLPSSSVAGEPFLFSERLPALPATAALIDMTWPDSGLEFEMQMRLEKQVLIRGMIRPVQRGLFRLERLQLTTNAPLGLWRLFLLRKEPFEWAVLPRPVPWTFEHAGAGRRAHLLEGDDLRDLRSYVPGDTLSRIHWRKAASDMAHWSVKRFEQQAGGREEELLRVDLRVPGSADAAVQFEQLLGRAWFWIEARLNGHGRIRVILGQHHFEPAEAGQRQALIRAIAAATPQQRPPAGDGGTLLSLVGQP